LLLYRKEKAMVHMSKRLSVAAVLVFGALGLGVHSAAAPLGTVVTMEASLAGSSEAPPSSSAGMGTLEATFNQDSHMLHYTVTYSGMSGPVKAGHFHGPAAPGANAGVVVAFAGAMDSPIKGTAVLTPSQSADLLAGKWYVNLHTAVNPGGEIRGQVQVK
jgi:hypothetical protein